jgi:hypothetical protein
MFDFLNGLFKGSVTEKCEEKIYVYVVVNITHYNEINNVVAVYELYDEVIYALQDNEDIIGPAIKKSQESQIIYYHLYNLRFL